MFTIRPVFYFWAQLNPEKFFQSWWVILLEWVDNNVEVLISNWLQKQGLNWSDKITWNPCSEALFATNPLWRWLFEVTGTLTWVWFILEPKICQSQLSAASTNYIYDSKDLELEGFSFMIVFTILWTIPIQFCCDAWGSLFLECFLHDHLLFKDSREQWW